MAEYELVQAFLKGLTPIERVYIDQWADKYMELSTESSKEAGRWNTDRTPYLREILRKLSPTDPAQRIVLAKGVQIGATVSGIIAMLAYAATDPCPMMYILPTIAIAQDFSKDKLQPMINGCSVLKDIIKDANSKNSGNNILGKRFRGGSINLAGANSAASLRSKTIRFITADEIDAYPRNLDKEGSPLTLAEKRQATYGKQAKLYIPSTPTVENASAIWSEFEDTDQRYYHIPCPHCGADQHLVFTQMRWTPGKPETAVYQCEHCYDPIEERFKDKFLIKGEWISSIPERRNDIIMGYHLNSLYSPYGWLSWEKIAREYEAAQKEISKDQEDNKMRAFTNTVLGLTYATSGERPGWKLLYDNNRENYERGTINNNVMVITIGVDIQKDRIELEVVGWGLDKRSWSINYHVIEGLISDKTVQEKLIAIANTTFVRPDLVQVPVSKICIDAGYDTTDVYTFVSSQDATRWSAVHGSPTARRIFSNPQTANKTTKEMTVFTAIYYMLGVDILKDELYTQLKKTRDVDDPLGPVGYCHFPEYDEIYFQGITAEQKVATTKDGFTTYKYDKKFQRNEPLDVRNYARAALAMLGYDEFGNKCLEMMFANYHRLSVANDVVKKKKSSYWGN